MKWYPFSPLSIWFSLSITLSLSLLSNIFLKSLARISVLQHIHIVINCTNNRINIKTEVNISKSALHFQEFILFTQDSMELQKLIPCASFWKQFSTNLYSRTRRAKTPCTTTNNTWWWKYLRKRHIIWLSTQAALRPTLASRETICHDPTVFESQACQSPCNYFCRVWVPVLHITFQTSLSTH